MKRVLIISGLLMIYLLVVAWASLFDWWLIAQGLWDGARGL